MGCVHTRKRLDGLPPQWRCSRNNGGRRERGHVGAAKTHPATSDNVLLYTRPPVQPRFFDRSPDRIAAKVWGSASPRQYLFSCICHTNCREVSAQATTGANNLHWRLTYSSGNPTCRVSALLVPVHSTDNSGQFMSRAQKQTPRQRRGRRFVERTRAFPAPSP